MITGECDGLADIYFPVDTMRHRLVSMGLLIISDNVYSLTFPVDNRLVDTRATRFYRQRLYQCTFSGSVTYLDIFTLTLCML